MWVLNPEQETRKLQPVWIDMKAWQLLIQLSFNQVKKYVFFGGGGWA